MEYRKMQNRDIQANGSWPGYAISRNKQKRLGAMDVNQFRHWMGTNPKNAALI